MRQFSCVELSLQDAVTLRDIIRPLTRVEPYDQMTLVNFCEKLYAAILKLRTDRTEVAVSIPLERHEALFINHFVGSEDWGGALALLEQTWLVLYELEHQSVYPRPREAITETVNRMSAGLSEANAQP
jgi:hypothetical protein